MEGTTDDRNIITFHFSDDYSRKIVLKDSGQEEIEWSRSENSIHFSGLSTESDWEWNGEYSISNETLTILSLYEKNDVVFSKMELNEIYEKVFNENQVTQITLPDGVTYSIEINNSEKTATVSRDSGIGICMVWTYVQAGSGITELRDYFFLSNELTKVIQLDPDLTYGDITFDYIGPEDDSIMFMNPYTNIVIMRNYRSH